MNLKNIVINLQLTTFQAISNYFENKDNLKYPLENVLNYIFLTKMVLNSSLKNDWIFLRDYWTYSGVDAGWITRPKPIIEMICKKLDLNIQTLINKFNELKKQTVEIKVWDDKYCLN
ncbi:hypothetical protein V2P24_00990 [Mycoplasma putrefaciens]|uniref:hypothetical protein n=1 Tax=Mycoplasma putrefaciens TaxID=2123 RepID=UPI003DA492B6